MTMETLDSKPKFERSSAFFRTLDQVFLAIDQIFMILGDEEKKT
jgi:hypothetical protein